MYNYFRNNSNAIKKVIEGLDATVAPTDPSLAKDPVYLATTNAANISILKDQVDGLMALKQQMADLTTRVTNNEKGINSLTTHFSSAGQQATGYDPSSNQPLPTPTGLS